MPKSMICRYLGHRYQSARHQANSDCLLASPSVLVTSLGQLYPLSHMDPSHTNSSSQSCRQSNSRRGSQGRSASSLTSPYQRSSSHSSSLRSRRTPRLKSKWIEARCCSNREGFGVFASRDISEGTTILKVDRPEISAIHPLFSENICASCFRYHNDGWEIRSPHSGSSLLVFCSRQCQNEWLGEYSEQGREAYEAVLHFFSKELLLSGRVSTSLNRWDKAEALAKQILKDRNEKRVQSSRLSAEKSLTIPELLDTMFALDSVLYFANHHHDWSRIESLKGIPLDAKKQQCAQHIFVHLHRLLPLKILNAGILTPKLVKVTLSACPKNVFGIRPINLQPTASIFGPALYIDASFFNHACPGSKERNVVWNINGCCWTGKVTRPVAKGEELMVSYLADEFPIHVLDRQTRVRRWGFECECTLCKSQLRELVPQASSSEHSGGKAKPRVLRLRHR